MVERLRFSPSPSRRLHLGLGRTAVFNWLHARRTAGELILRIDDTDPGSCCRETAARTIDTLRWLGIEWAGEVSYQSRHNDEHRAAAERLIASGQAYRDFDLTAARPERHEERRPRCRKLTAEESQQRADAGDLFVVRFRVDAAEPDLFFDDLVFGPRRCVRERVEDFLLCRVDGSATYHLATVVDDISDAITLVMRGQEHIPSTMRQLLLYEALGSATPRFAHLPLLVRPKDPVSGQRGPQKCLEDYREASVLPSAMRAYLAQLGWTVPGGDDQLLDDDRLLTSFDLGRVSRAPVNVDEAPLWQLNAAHLHSLPAEHVVPAVEAELERRSLPSIVPADTKLARVDLARSHASTVPELVDRSSGLLGDDFEVDAEQLEQACSRLPVAHIIDELLRLLGDGSLDDWEQLHRAIVECVTHQDLSSREVGYVLQLALAGAGEGPPLKAVFELLGRDRVEDRLRALATRCSGL